jgi:hypothetical protein
LKPETLTPYYLDKVSKNEDSSFRDWSALRTCTHAEKERLRERERETERESKRESKREREREGERESKREREKERERALLGTFP